MNIFFLQVHILSVILLYTERVKWLRRSARGRCRGDGAQSLWGADEVLTGPEGREETCECRIHAPETTAHSGEVQYKKLYFKYCCILSDQQHLQEGRKAQQYLDQCWKHMDNVSHFEIRDQKYWYFGTKNQSIMAETSGTVWLLATTTNNLFT